MFRINGEYVRLFWMGYARLSIAGNADGVAELYATDATMFFSGGEWHGRVMIRERLRDEFSEPDRKPPAVEIEDIFVQKDGQAALLMESFTEPDGTEGKAILRLRLEDGALKIGEELILSPM